MSLVENKPSFAFDKDCLYFYFDKGTLDGAKHHMCLCLLKNKGSQK